MPSILQPQAIAYSDIAETMFLAGTTISPVSDTEFITSANGYNIRFFGTGFTYAANGRLSGGMLDEIRVYRGAIDQTNQKVIISSNTDLLSYNQINSVFSLFALGNEDTAVANVMASWTAEYFSHTKYPAGYLRGYQGDDFLSTGVLNNLVEGFDGDDSILTGGGDDRAYGGAGNDFIYGGNGSDILFGDDGNDQIRGGDFGGIDSFNLLFGGDGDDFLYGGNRGNRMFGDKGDDLIFGSIDADTAYGGDGFDILVGDRGNDLLFGGDDEDQINGGSFDDRLFGGAGNDALDGTGGNDILSGDDGDDQLNGGSGNDRLAGGVGSDNLKGATGDDILLGGAGDDILNAGFGNDRLFGGLGFDRLISGAGDDILAGGADADRFVIASDPLGHDLITDFQDGIDTLEINGLGPDPRVHARDTGSGHVVFEFDNGQTLVVRDITIAALTDDLLL